MADMLEPEYAAPMEVTYDLPPEESAGESNYAETEVEENYYSTVDATTKHNRNTDNNVTIVINNNNEEKFDTSEIEGIVLEMSGLRSTSSGGGSMTGGGVAGGSGAELDQLVQDNGGYAGSEPATPRSSIHAGSETGSNRPGSVAGSANQVYLNDDEATPVDDYENTEDWEVIQARAAGLLGNRAEPAIVQQVSASNGKPTTSDHDPVLTKSTTPAASGKDELVTYMRGAEHTSTTRSDGTSGLKQGVRSWITSPLVQQFNKDSTGNEVTQTFAPKLTAAPANRAAPAPATAPTAVRQTSGPSTPPVTKAAPTSHSGFTVTKAAVTVDTNKTTPARNPVVIKPATTPPASSREPPALIPFPREPPALIPAPREPPAPIPAPREPQAPIPVITAEVEMRDGEKTDVSKMESQRRSFELAKAIEAAEFKPVHAHPAPTQKPVAEKSPDINATEEKYEGLSMYSKSNVEPTLAKNRPGLGGQPNLQKIVETLAPGWKAEVERRKQTKEFVVATKPDQPLRMAEMPAWKRDLQEKKKMQRLSSSGENTETDHPLVKRREGGALQDGGDTEWKAEIKQILKQKSIKEDVIVQMREKPEWERLADERR